MLILIYVDSFICPLYLKFSQIFLQIFSSFSFYSLYFSQSYPLCPLQWFQKYLSFFVLLPVWLHMWQFCFIQLLCQVLQAHACFCWLVHIPESHIFHFFSCCVAMNSLYLLNWWWCAVLWYDGWYKSNIFSRQFSCWECYLPFFSLFLPSCESASRNLSVSCLLSNNAVHAQ